MGGCGSCKACLEQGQLMPNVPRMGRFFTALSAALELATAGRLSAQEALAEAARDIEAE